MRPLVIDNFAGGGGASTGIERALGRRVDVAINHDREAIAMHEANHPETRHLIQSIMAVDPLDATGGAPVALAWFSPDCKHHSKAKGGKPREKNIRDLAWVVPHWAERCLKGTPNGRGAIQVIILENVEEFRQWGPLDADGKPIKERRGEEFDLWVCKLRRLGYKVEWRELRACDYGAPTSRKRLFLIARRDGHPIVWPEPTHGKPGSPEVESGARRPWRTAAECIDWSIPCPLIFDRKRPLKDATHRRIAHGVMRYVVNAARPFIVGVGGRRGQSAPADVGMPYPTITAKADAAIVDAAIVPITHTGDPGRAHDPAQPLRTITTANGGEFARATVTLAPHVTKFRSGSVGSDAGDPMPTVTANGDSARPAGATPLGVVTAHLEKFAENARGRPADAPLDTVMAGAPRHAAVTAFLSHFYTSNTNGGRGDPLQPAKAITAEGQHHAVVCAHMEQASTGGMIGRAVDQPLTTITTSGSQQRLVQTTMIEADALPAPLMARAVQVAAFLVKYYGTGLGAPVDQPVGTVTTLPRYAVVTVTIDAVTYVIVDIGMRMLTRRELANAQGFPPGYVLDPIGPAGKPLSISSSIRMIGNSVCPDMAEALARANVRLVDAEEQEAA
ncbi:DNA cytosine methyltransferase [Sphingomonas sp. CCH9-F2]|uniref:DNA cytosine methyltransferase n=1 Tax=Sphingomonas sp. CCH9-F2 TaxID=1768778 RepID=UPI00082DEE91|nr:DNA cytosine methyltransferase [Sphingomonas sp. CCH9-F2]